MASLVKQTPFVSETDGPAIPSLLNLDDIADNLGEARRIDLHGQPPLKLRSRNCHQQR
jgi:hypothetical protein